MAITDYSGMEKEVKDAPQPKILPKGTEAKFRIIAVRTGTSEKPKSFGAKWFQPVFDCPDDPMVIEFNDFFWDLSPQTRDKIDPKQWERNKYHFQTFIQSFHIDISKPFDMEVDWVGKTGWIVVGIKTDEQYGDKNSVSEYTSGPGSISSQGPVDDNDIPF